jgi:antitoxin component HigA of HigAB toxin-antitoxin module
MTIIQILDKLRDERNITITDFCDGVCSRSNYSRYLNHEQKIPYDVLEQLSTKLGLSIMHILRDYSNSNTLKQDMNQLLTHIQNSDINKIKESLDTIDLNNVMDSYYYQFYTYALFKYQYLTKEINYQTYYQKLQDMVEYIFTQDNPEPSSFEYIILHELATLEITYDDLSNKTLMILKDILLSNSVHTIHSENANFHLPTFMVVAKHLAIKKDYVSSMYIVNQAITLSLEFDASIILDSAYYLKGILELIQEDIDNAIDHYKLCLYTALSKQDKSLFDFYKKIILKDLDGIDANIDDIKSITY